jgi:DNA-binding LacI/PurR family transcriptional regulator
LRDIARELGMSHVAVSLALRGSQRVSAARRDEVKAMAEKLGYRPDPMLASLVAYRQGKRPAEVRSCLGWINQWDQPEKLRSFKEFDRYWVGASEAAEKLGYRLEEFRWPMGKSGKRLQSILQTRSVRGLLIPPHRDGMNLPDFDWSQFSLVRFGSSVTNLRAHTITSDQSHCSRLAYEKLKELGHTRIGYVSDELFENNTKGHFREGYLNAQEELSPRRGHLDILMLNPDPHFQSKAVLAWIKKQKPDAIVTSSSTLHGLLDGLGIRVPGDIVVATTSVLDGNFDMGADQNSYEIGRVAVSTLASLIIENERGIPTYQRRILVEGRWVAGKGA